MITVKDSDAGTVQTKYDAAGRKLEVNLPGDISVNYQYDSNNQVKSILTNKSGKLLKSYSYEYDTNGNMLSLSDQRGKTNYEYDINGRLVSIQEPTGKNIFYSYDNVGNRLSEKVTDKSNESITQYSYDPANKLIITKIGESNIQYKYDKNGNLLEDGQNVYGYNALNQLTNVISTIGKDSQIYSSYKYNGDGIRTYSLTNGKEINYNWFGDQILSEDDGNGNIIARNVYGLERVARVLDKGSSVYNDVDSPVAYYQYDGHLDVRTLTNSTGNIIEQYDYDAWGNVESSNHKFDNPYLYGSEYKDSETGNYYLRARYYQPSVGRFLTQDTYQGSIDDPQSLHLYTYVQNNPTGYLDPSGHIVETPLDILSVGYSTYQFIKNPTWSNGGYLAMDIAAAVVPYVPGSYVARGVGKITKASDVAEFAETVISNNKSGNTLNPNNINTPVKCVAPSSFSNANNMNLDLQYFATNKGTDEINYVNFNKTHKDSLPKPKGDGPNGGKLQSHHGLQQEWAKNNLSQYGYNFKLAPTITIETGKGLPHTTITNAQSARRNERMALGVGKWSTTLQEELQFMVGDLTNAGFSRNTTSQVLEQQYKMLNKLGVKYERIDY